MYGAIVAAMLTTTAPAAPDWSWWAGFGCGPSDIPGWCGGYPWWQYCAYGYAGCGWPAWYCPPAGGEGPGAREQALEAQVRELREQLRRLQGTRRNNEATAPAPARVIVRLPADARLFIDEDACPLTSAERSFDTPDLQPGVAYHYTIRAELTRDGRAVKESKRVTVRAGEETVVEFGEMKTSESATR